MPKQALRLGIIGCGNIAPHYGRCIQAYPQLKITAAYDVQPASAAAYVAKFGGAAEGSLESLLAREDVDVAVNFTPAPMHYKVIRECLMAGKHVYSEKPLALVPAEARALVKLAQKKKLRLACAPVSVLGEAQQTAWKLVRSGALGKVRLINAEANHDRIEDWHPAPEVFYAHGPVADVGPYWLTFMTMVFGPVTKVTAYGHILKASRVTKAGRPFKVGFPDYFVTMLEFADGAVARFTINFYVGWRSRQNGIEIHGDKARLAVANWHHRDAEVSLGPWGGDYGKVPLVREAGDDLDWARGLADLEEAIRKGTPHRASGEQAAHLVEVIHAIHASARTGKAVAVKSGFPRPKPMAWAA